MKRHIKEILITFIVFISVVASIGQARLPKLISDSMVLQRDAKINIWGCAVREVNYPNNTCDKLPKYPTEIY
jgi:hypothetical protein